MVSFHWDSSSWDYSCILVITRRNSPNMHSPFLIEGCKTYHLDVFLSSSVSGRFISVIVLQDADSIISYSQTKTKASDLVNTPLTRKLKKRSQPSITLSI